MAKLEAVDSVVVWVRDQAKAREFYTRILGLKVVDDMPEGGWLTVAPQGKGSQLALLAPDPGRPDYEAAKAQIGAHTGLGFECGDLKATLELLQARGVGITWASLDPNAAGGLHATIEDQDGNTMMLFQPTTKARGKGGLERLSFINVVVRDLRAAQAFYTGSLGLAAGEEIANMSWVEVRAGKGDAGLGLLAPVEEMYEEPADYEEDLRHLGEHTGITFLTRNAAAVFTELRSRGVQFTLEPALQPWGLVYGEFRDPDGNTFGVMQQPVHAKPAKAKPAKAKPRAAPKKAKPAKKTPARGKPAKAKPKAAKRVAAKRKKR